jgi:magnesium-transporting ATPase (P-type)
MEKKGLKPKECKPLDFIPFDAKRRKTEAIVMLPGGRRVRIIKGAVPTLQDDCQLSEAERARV